MAYYFIYIYIYIQCISYQVIVYVDKNITLAGKP